jgi:hypothetical protein
LIPRRYLAVVFTALIAAVPATAEGVGWSYDVTVTPTNITTSSDPSVALTGLSGTSLTAGQVGAFQVTTFGVGFAGEGVFDPTLQLFSVDFNLKDIASDASQVLTFQGGVGGVINQAGADLQFGFNDPTSQMVTLGDTTYEVSLLPFHLTQDADAGAPQVEDLPTIMAEVNIVLDDPPPAPEPDPDPNPNPDPSPAETPEPGTLTLAAFGLAGLATYLRRAKKQSA